MSVGYRCQVTGLYFLLCAAAYDGLRGISEHGAWNDWLEYFLLGVARMSEDALSRTMRINGLLADWQKKVSGESSTTRCV
jgi:hypothetical protein